MAAAYGSELVQDNNGNTKPTALHFTAGQQAFLETVAELQDGVTRQHVEQALFGPWIATNECKSLSWDATIARLYALRATNPSGEKRGGVPGADWLAYVGMEFLRVGPWRGQLVTTAVEGGWKDSTFTWPIWTSPCGAPAVRSLLSLPQWVEDRGRDAASAARKLSPVLGVSVVFRSSIMRSDQGGYGSFAPAIVV